MPPLNASQLALVRTHPQRSQDYLYPVLYSIALAALVNDPAIAPGARVITYDTVTLGAFGNIEAGMTLWLGTAPNTYDQGRVRVISATAATITVAENNDVAWTDNYYLTVKAEWSLWQKRGRIDAGTGTIYKDYNIAYSDQTDKYPPVVMMGDHCIKIMESVSQPVTVYWDAAESYAIAPAATISSAAWIFESGTPATSAVLTPGNVSYNSYGTFQVKCTITDSNGKTSTGRRSVTITDRSTTPYTNFVCERLETKIDGGAVADFRVRGGSAARPDLTIANFPNLAMIFYFSEDYYGEGQASVGYPRDREHIKFCGYIADATLRIDPETNDVLFTAISLADLAQRTAGLPFFVQDKASPATWAEAKSLTVRRALFYCIYFHSTLMEVADVWIERDDTPVHTADFPKTDLWGAFSGFANVHRLMRSGVTKTGRVNITTDPQVVRDQASLTAPGFWQVFQMVMGDWKGEINFPAKVVPAVSFLDVWGLYYSGTPGSDPLPAHAIAPGPVPKEYGNEDSLPYLITQGQTEINLIASNVFGGRNGFLSEFSIELSGNWWSAIEPAWQELIQGPVGGWTTKRGVVFPDNYNYFIVRALKQNFDWTNGYQWTTVTLEQLAPYDFSATGAYPTDITPTPAGTVSGPYKPTEPSVPAAPVADFTASPLTGAAPLAVTFTDASTGEGIRYYSYRPLPSELVIGKDVTFTFTQRGLYTVTHFVKSPYGTDTKTRLLYINVT